MRPRSPLIARRTSSFRSERYFRSERVRPEGITPSMSQQRLDRLRSHSTCGTSTAWASTSCGRYRMLKNRATPCRFRKFRHTLTASTLKVTEANVGGRGSTPLADVPGYCPSLGHRCEPSRETAGTREVNTARAVVPPPIYQALRALTELALPIWNAMARLHRSCTSYAAFPTSAAIRRYSSGTGNQLSISSCPMYTYLHSRPSETGAKIVRNSLT